MLTAIKNTAKEHPDAINVTRSGSISESRKAERKQGNASQPRRDGKGREWGWEQSRQKSIHPATQCTPTTHPALSSTGLSHGRFQADNSVLTAGVIVQMPRPNVIMPARDPRSIALSRQRNNHCVSGPSHVSKSHPESQGLVASSTTIQDVY